MKGGRYLAFGIIPILILWGAGAIEAAEALRYTCSAQVYEAVERLRIDMFTQKTGIPVKVSVVSSHEAVADLLNGRSDLAGTAEPLAPEERDAGLLETPFCKDPMAIVANRECTVKSLTEAQIRGVFSGAISNWKELGGPDRVILRIVPGVETAACRNFKRMVMQGKDIKYDILTRRSTMVIEEVRFHPWSISFIAQGAAHWGRRGLQLIKVNGIHPGDERYPYYQIFSLVTRGKPTATIQAFTDFARSDQMKTIISNIGMVPLSGER
jgi:phosphate transport system substrate-binding protein